MAHLSQGFFDPRLNLTYNERITFRVGKEFIIRIHQCNAIKGIFALIEIEIGHEIYGGGPFAVYIQTGGINAYYAGASLSDG